ncbi:IDEAL domain-containing protein [Metabacillus herbersteinensis]|uniref:IDEAL domain-containing protein n=1 Tax=Metabacillus herbersteinensis TaxID=283816 RepID=A0ABV6GJW6_9BACI
MENNLLNAPQPVNVMDSLFAEMVLDKALLDFRKDQILKEIDQTLQVRDKGKFLRLIEELKIIS